MPRFRKKPVEIEAMQYDGTQDSWREITDWADDVWHRTGDRSIEIHTLEGTMLASVGDWVIRGVKGEFYPCKPDIFEKTYEVIGE